MPGAAIVSERPSIRILVVDDEPDLVDLLREILERAGYQVDTAANGQIALDKVDAATYDVIVCDLRMPVLGGLEFYLALERRRSALTGRLLFILADPGAAQDAVLRAPGVPTLLKPFSEEDLLQAVRRIVVG